MDIGFELALARPGVYRKKSQLTCEPFCAEVGVQALRWAAWTVETKKKTPHR